MKTKIALLVGLIFILVVSLPASVKGTPDDYNESLWLDGTGYVRITNYPALNPPAALTIEAWVYRYDDSRCETIIGKNFTDTFWLGFCSANLRFWNAGSWYESNAVITDTLWTHVAVSLDNGNLKFYINGMHDHSLKQPFTIPSNTEDWVIGADYDGSYPFMGSIVGVRLWDRVLSQEEIQRNMTRQIDTPQPGLMAAWELQGNAEEMFGNYPGKPFGGATFTAGPPPTHTADPLLIPTLPGLPTMDGICLQSEYGSLKLPIWVDPAYGQNGLVWAYVMATSDQLYVCMERFPIEITSAEVYVDTTGDGGTTPKVDDYRIRAIDGTPPTQESERGDGEGGWGGPGLTDYQAIYNHTPELYHSAEFRLPRSVFASLNTIFRLQLEQNHREADPTNDYDFGWPVDFNPVFPTRWPRMQIDTQTYVRPDSSNPAISSILVLPNGVIRLGDTVTLRVFASDDVDLAEIDIFIDGATPVHSCTIAGLNDRSAICSYTISGGLPLGTHTYYARAWDHRSRIGWSTRSNLFVQASGDRPKITVTHSPVQAAPGHTVTVHAVVTDTEGVTSINIGSDLSLTSSGNLCTFSPPVSVATCDYTFAPPAARRIVYYWVTADDLETLESTTPRIPVLFGNTGTDSDSDGLTDTFETLLGTHPLDPDTDHDTLMDGYEVLGMYFPGDATHFSDYINLPAMGANPRFKDVFVQYDYERGARYQQRTFDFAVSVYRRHWTFLHITENERPRSGTTFTSTLDAETASYAIMPGTGQYYFKPILNWTHNYIFSRHALGSSYYKHYYYVTLNTDTHRTCWVGTPDPQATCARNTVLESYGFFHELGHELGLGHGGRKYGDFWREAGGFIHYGTFELNYDQINFKPNYISTMNYIGETSAHASLMCYNPTTDSWLGENEYSTISMPTLYENALDERPTSLFSTALRAQTCNGQSGFVPVTVYFCHPNGQLRTQLRITDGLHSLMWTWAPGLMSNRNVPVHDEGIDWNCDGTISTTPVIENINNNDVAPFFETMEANIDWSFIPSGRDCTIGYNGGYKQPQDYRDQIRGHDCHTGNDYGPLPTFPPMGLSLAAMTNGENISNLGSLLIPQLGAGRQLDPFTLFYSFIHPTEVATGSSAVTIPSTVLVDQPGAPVSDLITSSQDQGLEFFEINPAEAAFSPLPNLEICDGWDNDLDGTIDEDCPDTDGDGMVDTLDNCPQTYNADQADLDGNVLGDACQYPVVENAVATINPDNSVTLNWEGTTTDLLGFNVYRVMADGTQALLGSSYPSAVGMTYTDQPVDSGPYLYIIRAVNLDGIENGEAMAIAASVWVYLPNIIK